MKTKITTISVISAYFLFMSCLGIAAAAPRNAQKYTKESIRREITNGIACPEFLGENDGPTEVRAIVQVNESGKVTVDEINSVNISLGNYVYQQLDAMQLKAKGVNDKFVLVIKFRLT